jgi:AcrR family transcriptional regulator
VFERDGFVDARVADIADAAGTAHGSFYTYFDSKEAVFRVVVDETLEEIVDPFAEHDLLVVDPFVLVESANVSIYEWWEKNHKLLTTLDQVAGIHPEFYERVIEKRRRFVDRYARILMTFQARGLADQDLDARHAAAALGGMVEHSLRWWIGQHEPHDKRVALETLNKLWARSIGLSPGWAVDRSRKTR